MSKPHSVRPEVRAVVLELVGQIPRGEVASYGMIASLLSGVTARMVGHALRGADAEGIPWQRVINASGAVSAHDGSEHQRELLEEEGVRLSASGRIRWRDVRWGGPTEAWVKAQNFDPLRLMDIMATWPG